MGDRPVRADAPLFCGRVSSTQLLFRYLDGVADPVPRKVSWKMSLTGLGGGGAGWMPLGDSRAVDGRNGEGSSLHWSTLRPSSSSSSSSSASSKEKLWRPGGGGGGIRGLCAGENRGIPARASMSGYGSPSLS